MWTADALRPGGPRYLALADRIQRDIDDGTLRAGMRLPAQRKLAASLGVDLTTVSRGYAEAGRRGLVAGEAGRGTFVRPPAARVEHAGRGGAIGAVVDLSLNLPPAATLELAERELGRTLRRLPDSAAFRGLLEYQTNAGRLEHREAGPAWVARRGVHVSPERVIVTCGAQHALTVLLTTMVPPGQPVMTEALTYPVFKLLAEQLRLPLTGVATDGEGLRPDALRDACEAGSRTLYCTPSLQNPTTAFMSSARRRDIAEIVREFEVTVIEDDVYGMLPRDATPAFCTYAPERTFFVSSLSKAVAPGLRIAYVAAPSERAATQVGAGVRATAWMAAPVMAEVAASWIRDGVADRLVAANRREANARHAIASRTLARSDWRGHPESYHGWLTLPDRWSTAEFMMQARQHGIIVTPVDAFAVGPESAAPGVRLSLCAAASRANLERALAAVARILDTGPEVALSLL